MCTHALGHAFMHQGTTAMHACIHAMVYIVNLKSKWPCHILNNRKLGPPIFSTMFWNYSGWWHLLHQKVTNSKPNDAGMWKIVPTLVQIMICRPLGAKHYLKQWKCFVNWVLWKMAAILFWFKCINLYMTGLGIFLIVIYTTGVCV